MADTTGTSWSDIPLDLAGRILCRLPAHVDRVRFGAVCPQWRAATRHGPLPPPLPLLLLSDARVYSLPGSEKFHCAGSKGFTDACGDWLVFSGEEGYFLRDPWSNATVTVTLPPLSRVRTRLVGTDSGPVWSQAPERPPKWKTIFTRRGRDGGGVLNDDLATQAWMEMAETLNLKKKPKGCKLWLCSSNLIVATINFWGATSRIAVCQPGATSWWSVWVEGFFDFVDTAFHQGKLYAIDTMSTIFTIDVSVDQSSGDPWISQVRKVIDSPCLHMEFNLYQMRKMPYLVESRGVLLVVLRNLRHPLIGRNADIFEFEVFEVDLNHSQCFKVTAIGNNEVLFIRRRCSRSLCVSPNALPGGCIFFLVNDEMNSSWYGGKNSCRVYSMTDGKVSNPLPTVSWKPGMVFGTWLFPQN